MLELFFVWKFMLDSFEIEKIKKSSSHFVSRYSCSPPWQPIPEIISIISLNLIIAQIQSDIFQVSKPYMWINEICLCSVSWVSFRSATNLNSETNLPAASKEGVAKELDEQPCSTKDLDPAPPSFQSTCTLLLVHLNLSTMDAPPWFQSTCPPVYTTPICYFSDTLEPEDSVVFKHICISSETDEIRTLNLILVFSFHNLWYIRFATKTYNVFCFRPHITQNKKIGFGDFRKDKISYDSARVGLLLELLSVPLAQIMLLCSQEVLIWNPHNWDQSSLKYKQHHVVKFILRYTIINASSS